jgi:hypothetical protein
MENIQQESLSCKKNEKVFFRIVWCSRKRLFVCDIKQMSFGFLLLLHICSFRHTHTWNECRQQWSGGRRSQQNYLFKNKFSKAISDTFWPTMHEFTKWIRERDTKIVRHLGIKRIHTIYKFSNVIDVTWTTYIYIYKLCISLCFMVALLREGKFIFSIKYLRQQLTIWTVTIKFLGRALKCLGCKRQLTYERILSYCYFEND